MPHKYIIDNIRLVLDILDYSDLTQNEGFILLLDFHNAFDSIEHGFLFETLKLFNFGEHLIKSLPSLYTSENSSMKFPYWNHKKIWLEKRNTSCLSCFSIFVFISNKNIG